MRQQLYRGLTLLQAPRALAWAQRRKVLVLMYHGFTDRAAHPGIENFQGLHQHVDMFRRHLQYLRDNFSPVSLHAVVDHYAHARRLPPNPVVVTMDDGYQSNYALAFPLLREYQIPATVFLTTDFVDAKRYLWTDRVEYAVDQAELHALAALLDERAPADLGSAAADQSAYRRRALLQLKGRLKQVPQEQRAAVVDRLEERAARSLAGARDVPAIYQPLEWSQIMEMCASGLVAVGSHTASHFILSRCAPDVVRSELSTAKRIIEERTGAPCPLFCYPNGAPGDFDGRTRAAVREVGHSCALTTVTGLNDARSDVYELRRVGVLNVQSFEDFVMTVTGVTSTLMALGDRLRKAGLRN